MPDQIGFVQLATQARILRRGACDQPGSRQTVETLFRGAGDAAKQAANGVGEIRVPAERGAHPAQVAAEHSVRPVRLRYDRSELQPILFHLQKGTAHQIGMPADELQETSNLCLSTQRLSVQSIQSG